VHDDLQPGAREHTSRGQPVRAGADDDRAGDASNLPVGSPDTDREVTMLDHAGLNVGDIAQAKRFYEEALAPIGYTVGHDGGSYVGFRSPEGELDFWIAERGEPSTGTHVAFRAGDRTAVAAFHRAALAAGGTDNGAPGVRAEYHDYYYGAYVLDPAGNNIEAVCHRPAE
jgi:catechol 2,3-dioxygenase-like lactoylglutathione lyase family enzyme